MAGENRKMRKLTGAVMVVVTVVTVFMVKGFLDQANAAVQAQVQRNTQSIYHAAVQPGETGSEAGQADSIPALTEADYAAAQAFAARYAGTWNVQKYYDGQEWKIYELGKRMAIVAYNFLNDYSYTTGGYSRIVGYDVTKTKEGETCSKCDVGTMRRETGLDALLAPADALRCDFCGYEEVIRSSSTPKYEDVPEERHEVHGQDIEYSTPAITISDQGVDMSEMGGPIFYLEGFRVETIGGREYLVNVYFDFAITHDGNYLEYCEPTISGGYQGYYAFN